LIRRRAAGAALAVLTLACVGPAGAEAPPPVDRPGPVGLALGPNGLVWVAFDDAIHGIDLDAAPGAPARVVGTLRDGWETKSPATCPSCDFVLFTARRGAESAIYAAPLDGSRPPVALRAPGSAAGWKQLVLHPSGRTAYATDSKRDRIWEFAIDPEGPAITGEGVLAEIDGAYFIHLLADGTLLVSSRSRRLHWLGLDGRVRAEWNLREACGFGVIRAVVAHPRTGMLYLLKNRSVMRIEPTDDGSGIASCVHVVGAAGSPEGFRDACGHTIRFDRPHDLEVAADGTELLVSDTGNDALRRIPLEPGPGAGCVTTRPLGDAAGR